MVPNYSVTKLVPKLCHNELECIWIKCINLISDGRFQVLQWIREISIVSILHVTPLKNIPRILVRTVRGLLYPVVREFFAINTIKRSPKPHQEVRSSMGRAQSCMKQYHFIILGRPTSGSKQLSRNSQHFNPVAILSMNIWPIKRFDDMEHHLVILYECSGETTCRTVTIIMLFS